MAAYSAPTFQERAALARRARQTALDQLRAKPPLDDAAIEQRRAARLKREAAAEANRAKRESEMQAKADKQRAVAKAAADRAASAEVPERTEQEKKAARDARYAARKKRK